jgi:16S rRNA C967 or C1407 C5-methylase (RsmB/RsmF family)
MGKKHIKGSNKSAEKKRRQETEAKWRSQTPEDSNQRRSSELSKENARFEAFYKAQHFVGLEEWEKFINSLREPLPACFRFKPDYVFSDSLRKELHTFVGQSIDIDGVSIRPVEELKWYPGNCAYKLGTDRRNIRKQSALEGLHQWMIMHTDNGNITRQEAVSMVPPLALNVLPHHKCLDMCAAPGSKTSQLLEIIHPSLRETDAEKQGLVVANDADTDRAYMLVHQCKRINSPLLVVTTHKGQQFPTLMNPIPSITSANGVTSSKNEFFDRILCDVPCSGRIITLINGRTGSD